MSKLKINYVVLGDIHLGHPINKTSDIVENLRHYFLTNHKLFSKADIIFLEGDVFHKFLRNSSDDYIIAIEWLSELINYCSTFKIKLRILEGTPSHDWKQAKLVQSIINKLHITVDFKYISTLYIEKMTDLGLSILYVPDEYKHQASEVYSDTLALLKENNLSQVDIAIMHGQFSYQLPMVQLASSHDENKYMDIVKYFITINHIHTPSVFKRIIAPGSFDRLAHGEEEDKGGVYISIEKNKSPQYLFIKNPKARWYKTLNYAGKTIDEIMPLFKKDIKKIPPFSSVRLIVDKDSKVIQTVKEFKKQYFDYVIDIDNVKTKQLTVGEKIVNDNVTIETFNITKENIHQLLFKELEKHNLSNNEIHILKQEMDMLLEAI